MNNIFGESRVSEESTSEHNLMVATAALLLEIANIDDEFSEEEQREIVEVLKDRFNVTSDEVEEILKATQEDIDQRIDMYYFTNQINVHFSSPEKMQIIESVWRVIYADKHLDGHEDYLVHRFAKLLRLDHSQLIEAKLRVKKQMAE
ncbi:MAG: TerB family tellurite resistance protein [FCB group bacterium]|nr:TerB family tellurite resistance protein [FCB group bacterium]